MTSWRYQLAILVFFVLEVILDLNGSLVLVKSTDIVLENTTLTLTCSNLNDRLISTRWKSSIFDSEAVCARSSTGCFKTMFLNISSYDCSCNENGTFSVYLRRVSRLQHGVNWTCMGHGDLISNKVEIKVAVPLTQLVLNHIGKRSVNENSTTTFQCNTSYSLPAAIISWYRSKGTSKVELTNSLDREIHITRETYTREDNLISVKETFIFKVNRSVHDWEIFCNTSTLEYAKLTSNRIALLVIYPPDLPPLIHDFTNGSTYKAIENTRGSLLCSVEGGNPLATLRWVCMNLTNNSSEEIIDNTKVMSNLSWSVTRTQGISCRCQTEHVLSNEFTFVNVDVLYPPTVLTVQLQYQNNKANVTIYVKLIESKTYSLKCTADGNPPPADFTWSGPHSLTVSNKGSLGLLNAQRGQNGTYSCMAQNIMIPTYGGNKTGNKSMSLNVDILYKPTVAKLINRDVAERSSLSIACKVNSSNPNITDVVWTRERNDWEIHSNPLILRNISRHDSMNYTCTMKNKMTPTVGKEEEGQDSASFHLNVWYKASVRKFVVPGHEKENPVIVNTNTTIQFNCEIDSNPGSFTSIISPSGTELWSAASNNMSYSHVLSSCLDRGKYTCSGLNKYNQRKPGNASLSLLVNCKPMAYYPVKGEEVIRSALYVPVTLDFTAIAYPEPEFTWEIWKNSSWSKLKNDSMFLITSSYMKSNLTVNNFTSTQAMLFRLVLENFMGRLTQNYALQPFDRPDKPLNFSHIVTYLTDTTVMLSWRPGFNGGLPQNFTLMHRRLIDQEWNTSVFPDTGQDLMNFTVRGLNTSTVYVFQIYAENIKNRSGITEIVLMTKAPVVEAEPNSARVVNIVIGCIVSLLVFTVTTTLIVFGCRRYKMKKTRDHERAKGVTSYENMTAIQAISEEEVFETKETIYEELKGEKDRGSHEKMEMTYETLNQDRDDVKSTNPVYANLKL